MGSKINRIGEINTLSCGEDAVIIEYNSASNMIVRIISTGELIKCTYREFCNGSIKSHYTPTVYNVGITGIENAQNDSYRRWLQMIRRCYDKKELSKSKRLSYKNCAVCEKWLYYPNFKTWYDSNYYKCGVEQMHLDKDILHKNNKIYSPNNCLFVPQRINDLFVKGTQSKRKLPIGVLKRGKRYLAQCNTIKTNKLGSFDTPEEAFYAYKTFKEKYIKQIADEYKNK